MLIGPPKKTTAIDIAKNIQKVCMPVLTIPAKAMGSTTDSLNPKQEPWFLEINPNGRIPALTDTFTDGSPIRLFESGSIMQYLVDRYDPEHKLSYPRGTREYYEVNSWVRVSAVLLRRMRDETDG